MAASDLASPTVTLQLLAKAVAGVLCQPCHHCDSKSSHSHNVLDQRVPDTVRGPVACQERELAPESRSGFGSQHLSCSSDEMVQKVLEVHLLKVFDLRCCFEPLGCSWIAIDLREIQVPLVLYQSDHPGSRLHSIL